MKRNTTILLSVTAVALLAGAIVLAYLVPRDPQLAPEVAFTLLDGGKPELAGLRGRPVLINFWSTSCTVCMQEIPALVALHERFGPRGLQVIGVAMSYDPPDQVVQFQARRQLPYPISLDIDGQIARSFGGIAMTPTTVLVTPDGVISYAHQGLFDVDAMAARIVAMVPGEAGN